MHLLRFTSFYMPPKLHTSKHNVSYSISFGCQAQDSDGRWENGRVPRSVRNIRQTTHQQHHHWLSTALSNEKKSPVILGHGKSHAKSSPHGLEWAGWWVSVMEDSIAVGKIFQRWLLRPSPVLSRTPNYHMMMWNVNELPLSLLHSDLCVFACPRGAHQYGLRKLVHCLYFPHVGGKIHSEFKIINIVNKKLALWSFKEVGESMW